MLKLQRCLRSDCIICIKHGNACVNMTDCKSAIVYYNVWTTSTYECTSTSRACYVTVLTYWLWKITADYLGCVSDGEADAQVVDSQLQEEGAEGLYRGLLDAWQLVHHLFGGHMDVLIEGHALLIPVVICCFIIQPEEHSCRRAHG